MKLAYKTIRSNVPKDYFCEWHRNYVSIQSYGSSYITLRSFYISHIDVPSRLRLSRLALLEETWRRAKELRQWLKIEWADLWKSKQDDEIRAEGFSIKDYSLLFVDRGEIVHATRDYKPLSFREILEKHVGSEDASRVDLDPRVGGWRKFARQNFPVKGEEKVKRKGPGIKHDLSQHQRKGGRGFRNMNRILRKKRYNEYLER